VTLNDLERRNDRMTPTGAIFAVAEPLVLYFIRACIRRVFRNQIRYVIIKTVRATIALRAIVARPERLDL